MSSGATHTHAHTHKHTLLKRSLHAHSAALAAGAYCVYAPHSTAWHIYARVLDYFLFIILFNFPFLGSISTLSLPTLHTLTLAVLILLKCCQACNQNRRMKHTLKCPYACVCSCAHMKAWQKGSTAKNEQKLHRERDRETEREREQEGAF